jgi:hypothetical protein
MKNDEHIPEKGEKCLKAEKNEDVATVLKVNSFFKHFYNKISDFCLPQ